MGFDSPALLVVQSHQHAQRLSLTSAYNSASSSRCPTTGNGDSRAPLCTSLLGFSTQRVRRWLWPRLLRRWSGERVGFSGHLSSSWEKASDLQPIPLLPLCVAGGGLAAPELSC
jgi:hypothetical protein